MLILLHHDDTTTIMPMNFRRLLRSEMAAWLVGGLVVAGLASLAFSYLGWLGIGLVGIIGLLISTRADLFGPDAIADSDHGSGAVGMYSRQLNERRSRSSSEEKLAAHAEQSGRSRVLYAVNTGFIGMIALGLGLFFLH